MLLSDFIATLGTLTILLLYGAGNLKIRHLYAINFIISFITAFQNPVGVCCEKRCSSPKSTMSRQGGMQAFSGSLVTVLAPALAAAVLSFAVAFTALLFFIKIPPPWRRG